jgi:Na+-translocating ferredoxin:NAD+ oxidoreductase RnfG subunit
VDVVAGLITQAVLPGHDDQVILALIAVIATSIAALVYTIRNNSLSRTVAKETSEINSAVNHKETGELSLYRLADANSRKLDDVIAKQAEFDRKWGNLPADMGDAVGLVELIHGMDKRIAQIQAQLLEHVEWEMAVKWKEGTP